VKKAARINPMAFPTKTSDMMEYEIWYHDSIYGISAPTTIMD
jgi:hypothetical protein